MYLNASTDKIEIVLGGTVATNQLQWNVSYQDITSSGMTLPQSGGAGLTNNATAVDIVAAPAASTTRQVTQINVYNADTATATVTIQKDVSGTNYVLMRIALTTLDVLMWSREDGWRVMSATGGGTTYTFSTGLTNTSGTVTANLSTGVAGGQSVVGGTAASNSLTLSSTTNATKGKILFGTSAYNEVNNRLGIGTQSPLLNVEISSDLNVAGFGDGMRISGFQNTPSYRPFVGFYRSRGTQASPTVTSSGDVAGSFSFFVYNGSVFNTTATIRSVQTGSHSGFNVPGNLEFYTNSGSAEDVRLQILSNGNVIIQNGGTYTDAGFRLDVNGTARVQTSLDTPIVRGGTGASGTLTLSSTSNATKGKILFGTSAYDEVNNRLGIGTQSPTNSVNIVGDSTSGSGELFLDRYGDSVLPIFSFRRARNTIASPNAILNTDAIGAFSFRGYNGTSFTTGRAAIISNATENWSSTANGANLSFQTTANGTTTQTERLRIFDTGNVFIGASPTDAGFRLDVNGTARFQGNVTISTKDIVTDTTTGSKIATGNTQKLGFWNATPIAQPTTAVAAATLVGGGGTTLTDTDTFDGYTLAQVVKALRNAGLLA